MIFMIKSLLKLNFLFKSAEYNAFNDAKTIWIVDPAKTISYPLLPIKDDNGYLKKIIKALTKRDEIILKKKSNENCFL